MDEYLVKAEAASHDLVICALCRKSVVLVQAAPVGRVDVCAGCARETRVRAQMILRAQTDLATVTDAVGDVVVVRCWQRNRI